MRGFNVISLGPSKLVYMSSPYYFVTGNLKQQRAKPEKISAKCYQLNYVKIKVILLITLQILAISQILPLIKSFIDGLRPVLLCIWSIVWMWHMNAKSRYCIHLFVFLQLIFISKCNISMLSCSFSIS